LKVYKREIGTGAGAVTPGLYITYCVDQIVAELYSTENIIP
jgi:hypothetical protein